MYGEKKKAPRRGTLCGMQIETKPIRPAMFRISILISVLSFWVLDFLQSPLLELPSLTVQ
jgi:hypothetical protein